MLYSYQQDTDATSNTVRSKKVSGYLQAGTVRLLWQPVENTKVSWNKAGLYGMGWQVVPYDCDGTLIYRKGHSDNLKDFVKSTTTIERDCGDQERFAKGTEKSGSNQDISFKGPEIKGTESDVQFNPPGIFVVGHTGGTVGASSVLLIFPLPISNNSNDHQLLTGSVKGSEDNVQDGTYSETTQLGFPIELKDEQQRDLPHGIVVSILSNFQGLSLGPVALELCRIFAEVEM